MGIGEWYEEAQACMRARHMSRQEQAFFLFDHLEGEAREEIKYRPITDRSDPDRIIAILKELYDHTESYVALQENFFSRRQQEGETLLEFSLSLLSLMDKVKQHAPTEVTNAETLLRDQFIEHVLDGSLRRELKQYARSHPRATLLEVRGEAMRWELEGLPASMRSRSNSVPSALGIQCVMRGLPSAANSMLTEVKEMKDMLTKQQDQINLLTQTIALLQAPPTRHPSPPRDPIICQRCQQPGHYARDCDGPRVPRPPRFPALRGPNREYRSEN